MLALHCTRFGTSFSFGAIVAKQKPTQTSAKLLDRISIGKGHWLWDPLSNNQTEMRALVQRVHSARVEVDHRIVSEIGPGLLVLVGFSHADTQAVAESMSHKILNLPVFDREEADIASHKSVMQKNYELLLVSQFSLYGVFKGNRLDFHDAMSSHQAKPLYEALLDSLCQLYDTDKIKDGIFGVKRQVFLVNNGPMAFQLDSETFGNVDN